MTENRVQVEFLKENLVIYEIEVLAVQILAVLGACVAMYPFYMQILGPIFARGKSNARVSIEPNSNVTFNDIAGIDEAK